MKRPASFIALLTKPTKAYSNSLLKPYFRFFLIKRNLSDQQKKYQIN